MKIILDPLTGKIIPIVPGDTGATGATGPQGLPGEYAINIDAGNASSIYGGITPINGGGA